MSVSRFFVRSLFYTDRSTDEEFGLPQNILDDLYGLFITTKDIITWSKSPSFTDFLNEVFFQITLLYDDLSAPEHISDFLKREMMLFPTMPKCGDIDDPAAHRAWDDYDSETHIISRYVYTFVWLIFKKTPNPPRNIRYALLALDKLLSINDNPFYETFKKFSETHKFAIDIKIEPNPDTSMIWLSSAEEWNYVTNDCDKDAIRKIVSRFRTLNDKQAVIKELKRYLAERLTTTEHPEISRVTYHESADEPFLDGLLMEAQTEQVKKEVEAKEIEQSKDDLIKKLQDENALLVLDKIRIESERDSWKRKYDHLVSKINERNQQIQQKHVPSEFRQLPGSEIIQQLVNEGLIRVLRQQIASDAYEELYKWEGSKKLFGYFVERVSDELSLRKSGKSGNIIWEPFMQAFYNAEDLRHEAASAISAMKKKGALMPDGADKIEEAIKYAEAMAMQYKD